MEISLVIPSFIVLTLLGVVGAICVQFVGALLLFAFATLTGEKGMFAAMTSAFFFMINFITWRGPVVLVLIMILAGCALSAVWIILAGAAASVALAIQAMLSFP